MSKLIAPSTTRSRGSHRGRRDNWAGTATSQLRIYANFYYVCCNCNASNVLAIYIGLYPVSVLLLLLLLLLLPRPSLAIKNGTFTLYTHCSLQDTIAL